MLTRLIAALLCLLATAATASDVLRLNTDILPPYQVREGEQLGGSSVNALDCIFRAMQQPYEIRVLPLQRAIHDVQQQRADGFFSATRISQIDSFARLSAPLALEKWYWYSNQPAAPGLQENRQRLRIGALRGSNQQVWLEQNGYNVVSQVGNHEQLLKLLQLERIDAFIADQHTLRMEMTQLPGNLRPDHQHFLKYSTLGVYFGKHFLERRQGFLDNFDHHIFGCLREQPKLNDAERLLIGTLYQNRFAGWVSHPLLIERVREQNRQHRGMGLQRILELDQQWVLESSQPRRPLITSVLSNPASHWLVEQQQASDGLVTEIILTDRFGLNAAVSEITTDYWQGDEEKFSMSFFSENGEPVVGQLDYDESTRHFQVHISNRLRDPDTAEVIGVLIVGLGIEQAMQLASQPE